MFETPIIRKFVAIRQVVEPEDATQPKILLVETETEIGPLVLRVTEIAAGELTAALNRHPLTRGSQ